MTKLDEIINDINITIADVETFYLSNNVSLPAKIACAIAPETKRAIGQLKAARASLVRTQEASK